MYISSHDKSISGKLANAIINFELDDARRLLAQPEIIAFLQDETVNTLGAKETNAAQLIRLAAHEAEINRLRGAFDCSDLIEEIGDLIEIAANNGLVHTNHGRGYEEKVVGIDGIVVKQAFDFICKPIGSPVRRVIIPPAKAVVLPLVSRRDPALQLN